MKCFMKKPAGGEAGPVRVGGGLRELGSEFKDGKFRSLLGTYTFERREIRRVHGERQLGHLGKKCLKALRTIMVEGGHTVDEFKDK